MGLVMAAPPLLLLLQAAAAVGGSPSGRRPHICFILADVRKSNRCCRALYCTALLALLDCLLMSLALLLTRPCAAAASPATRQDWGQYNAGYRGDPDSRTPAVDALAAEGLVLERLCVVAAADCC